YKIKVFQKIKEDHLVRKVRDIYVHNKFDQVADIYMDVVSSDIEEAKYYLCYTLNNWGLSLIEQAKTEIKEAARQRILHAIEKFEYAIDVMPDQYKLFNNLGMAQSELALIKSGKNAEKLYEQAIENFQTAIKYNPDCYNAYDNWGMALLYLAKMKSDEQAERIYSNALEIFKKVEEIKPNFAAYNLACLYSIQGKKDEALKWLEKGLKSKSTPSKEYILKDCDLENIKNTKEFKDLLK
ncbi:MAG: tetratricopeptide repeat protein, partial [Candidatus Helarchaeota archaeon]